MSTDTAPATKQKNYRLPVELAERLDAKAGELDVNAVDIVIEGLERELRRLGRGGDLTVIAKAKPSKRKRHRRSEEASGNRGGPPLGGNALDGANSTDAGNTDAPAASPRAAVHLPTVLGTWTGMPTSIMAREVVQGHVTVGGVVCRDVDVPAVERAAVRWNGQAV